jgi:hypothetical protein
MEGYRFFWYQADGAEPPHVHIWKDGSKCKVWLLTGEVAFNHGHATPDLRALVAVTNAERENLLRIWNDKFGH